MGNSEVGHLNIGAGRIVFQELSRINNAIKDGSIKENEVFVKAMDDVAATGKTLHLMGLMSLVACTPCRATARRSSPCRRARR